MVAQASVVSRSCECAPRLESSVLFVLLQQQRMHKYITIRLTPGPQKADLNQSATMQHLLHWMDP